MNWPSFLQRKYHIVAVSYVDEGVASDIAARANGRFLMCLRIPDQNAILAERDCPRNENGEGERELVPPPAFASVLPRHCRVFSDVPHPRCLILAARRCAL